MSKPTKYRQKPVSIEAMRLTEENLAEALHWCGAEPTYRYDIPGYAMVVDGLTIHTPEGDLRASIGEWIIRGAKGEFYPCKPDIFEATYEPSGSGFADQIVATENGGHDCLLIDGMQFPWMVRPDVEALGGPGEFAGLRITIMCNEVTVNHSDGTTETRRTHGFTEEEIAEHRAKADALPLMTKGDR